MELWQIDAPYFVAGLDVYKEPYEVAYAAPIIKYMEGWSMNTVEGYCKKKNWKLGRIR